MDSDNIAVIGFGSGGSGAMYYALSGEEVDGAVKAVASFHGELDHVANATVDMMGSSGAAGGEPSWDTEDVSSSWNNETTATWRQMSDTAQPQVLIKSGVNGDAMGDVIQLEKALIGMGANFELTHVSDTKEHFNVWNEDGYNPCASARSFDQFDTVLNKVFNASDALAVSDDGASPKVESTEPPAPSPADSTNSPEVASTGAPVAAPITKSAESAIAATVESTKSPIVAPITKSTESPMSAPVISMEEPPTSAPTLSPVAATKAPTTD